MIKQIWKLCVTQKNEIEEEEPIFSTEENFYFTHKYEDDNNSKQEEFSKEQRIKNMCQRWKINANQALYLINLVEIQQT